MKGAGGKKPWDCKTLGELKAKYKSNPKRCNEQYGHIEKSENVEGLGEITFRLNPASYFNLEEVVKVIENNLMVTENALSLKNEETIGGEFDIFFFG